MSDKRLKFFGKLKTPLQIIEAMDIIYFNSHFASKSEGEYQRILDKHWDVLKHIKTSENIFKQLQTVLIGEYFFSGDVFNWKQVKCIQKEIFNTPKKKSVLFKNLDSQPNIVVEKILLNLDRESILAFCDTSKKTKGQCVTLSEKMWKWLILRDCYLGDLDPDDIDEMEWSFEEYKSRDKVNEKFWLVSASMFGDLELVEILVKNEKYFKQYPEALVIAEIYDQKEIVEYLRTFLKSYEFIRTTFPPEDHSGHFRKNFEKYLEEAVELGNVSAIIALGYLKYAEYGNREEMEKYYEMAIEKGSTKAMIAMAKGVEIGNTRKEIKYYKMAIEKGDVEAMYELASNYRNKNPIKYYKMAIKKGHIESMISLGKYYEYGLKKYEEAEKYYKLAIKNGNSDAMWLLAVLYEKLKKESSEIEKYFEMSVKEGNCDGMFYYGIYYQRLMEKEFMNRKEEPSEENSKNFSEMMKYFRMAKKCGSDKTRWLD